ncbi:MAG: hypothetical protein RL885_29985 [Planctomycetota bacterium]
MNSRVSILGLALACLAGGFGIGNEVGSSAPVSSWPPSPDRIVNLTNAVSSGQSVGLTVRKNTFIPIYEVPKDQWLVVTDLVVEEWYPEQAGYLFLVEEKDADYRILLDNKFVGLGGPGPYHSDVGLTFGPGTSLGLWYPSFASVQVYPEDILVEYAITGYLTKAN